MYHSNDGLYLSILNGIAFGFITYAVLKAGTGKANEVSNGVWALAALFIAKFIFFAYCLVLNV